MTKNKTHAIAIVSIAQTWLHFAIEHRLNVTFCITPVSVARVPIVALFIALVFFHNTVSAETGRLVEHQWRREPACL